MRRRVSPLRAIRDARGLRRVDVASAAGVSLHIIHKLENGQFATLYVGTLSKVALALGVSPCELIPGFHSRRGKARGELVRGADTKC